jgi:hypothetical protein
MAIKIPNSCKIYQTAIATSSIARPYKIYANWDFFVPKETIWQPCFGSLNLLEKNNHVWAIHFPF